MKILQSEQELLNEAFLQLKQGFKARSSSDNIDTIGLDSWGLATLIAEYDINDSGTNSGLWLKNLEKAVEVAQALYARKNISRFIQFSQELIDGGAVSFKTAAILNDNDRKEYCIKRKEYFETYIQNQCTQYVYRLQPLTSGFLKPFGYSARSITRKAFSSGQVDEYFKYKDFRDKGYSGTIADGYITMDYGFYYTGAIHQAFNSIWWNPDID